MNRRHFLKLITAIALYSPFVRSSNKNLKIVDLTGAGDLFAAGFLHGYINKLSIKECLEKVLQCRQK